MALPKTILTTTDFSDASWVGVDYAVELAKETGAALRVIHVFDPAPFAPIATRGQAWHTDIEPEQDIENRIREELARVRQQRLAGLENAKTEMVAGENAAKAILEHAKENDIDLIVLSSHGRTGLAHFLVGSVAEKVVRGSVRPVLVVPSKAG